MAEKIKIYTKQVRSFWFCYSTLQGFDYSFKGGSIVEVQEKMTDKLRELNVSFENTEFIEPTNWQQVKLSNAAIKYARSRVDNLN